MADNPFYGLFSVAKGESIKSLCLAGKIRSTEKWDDGRRIFYFESNLPKVSEMLIKARQIILDRGWLQGASQDRTGRVCAHFATVMAAGSYEEARPALDQLLKTAECISYMDRNKWSYSVTAYNDRACDKLEDIIALFDETIEVLQGAGR